MRLSSSNLEGGGQSHQTMKTKQTSLIKAGNFFLNILANGKKNVKRAGCPYCNGATISELNSIDSLH